MENPLSHTKTWLDNAHNSKRWGPPQIIVGTNRKPLLARHISIRHDGGGIQVELGNGLVPQGYHSGSKLGHGQGCQNNSAKGIGLVKFVGFKLTGDNCNH